MTRALRSPVTENNGACLEGRQPIMAISLRGPYLLGALMALWLSYLCISIPPAWWPGLTLRRKTWRVWNGRISENDDTGFTYECIFYLKMLINPNLYRNPLIPPQVLCISTKFPFTVFWLQDMFHWTPPCVNVSLWSFKWGSQPPTPCGCWALLKSASHVFCCLLFPWRVVWRNLYIKGRGYFGRGWIAWKFWRGTVWK